VESGLVQVDNLASLPPWAFVAAIGYVLIATSRLFAPAWSPATASRSVNRVVRFGLLVIKGPMLLLILGVPAAALLYLGNHPLVWLALVGGLVFASLWHSMAAPRWRLWAYRTADDVQLLGQRAFAVGLIRPGDRPLASLVLASGDLSQQALDVAPSVSGEPWLELPSGSQRVTYEVSSWVGTVAVAYRLLGGGILAFFAYVPLFIAWGSIREIVDKPSDADLLAVAVLGGCSAVAYFLLLLAYRAFTGRGRKEDGGLLPPWAMTVCLFVFFGIGVAILISGVWQRNWRMIEGGFAYCCSATLVYFGLRNRKRAANQSRR
jgi:hypothetical protein